MNLVLSTYYQISMIWLHNAYNKNTLYKMNEALENKFS